MHTQYNALVLADSTKLTQKCKDKESRSYHGNQEMSSGYKAIRPMATKLVLLLGKSWFIKLKKW